MMNSVIMGIWKRSRRFWPAGALFLFAIVACAWGYRYFARESADPLTPAERAWLKAHPVIRLAPDPDFQPVEYFDGNGDYAGITADYVSLLGKRLGIRIEIVRLRDWDEIIGKAKSRHIDVYVATKNAQRADYMLFTRSFLEFPVVIIAREKAKGPLDLEKLEGMKVSVVSEYAAHNFIADTHPKVRLDPVPDVRTGLRKVSFGLSDAFVENLATATYYMEKEGLTNLRLAGDAGYSYKMGFCSRKDWPELNRILEKGLAAISVEEKRAIYTRWIPVEPVSYFASRKFRTALRISVAAILLLIAGVIAWNRALARQVRMRTGELEDELAERKRAEEALRESEEKFRVLAETIPAAVVVYQGEKMVYLNPTAIQATGYEERECLNMKFWDMAHDDFREMVKERGLARQRGEAVPSRYEYKWVTKNGEVRWSLLSSARMEYRGKAAGIATLIDITERKEMEEELRRSRDELEIRVAERTAELRRSKELLEEEICVRNRTERVITARLRLLEFVAGHTMDELLQAVLDEAEELTGSLIGFCHFLESDQKRLTLHSWSTRTLAEFCKAEGKGSHSEVAAAGVWADCVRERRPIIHNDYASLSGRRGVPPEHPRILRELVVPVFRGETIVAVLGVGNKPLDYTQEDVEAVSLLADLAWEIAERKQAEDALHLSRFCIDKAGIGIFQSDENGTIFNVNEHACKSLGYSKEELCSLSIFDIDLEITSDRMLELREILRDSGSVTHHTTHRRRDGTTFPVEITSNTLQFRGKEYGISFVKDITERKRMEHELRDSQEKYRSMVESYDGFIYICSQEYRIEFMNRKLLERSGGDASGGLCYEVLHGRDSVCPWCVNDRVFRGETVHWEIQCPKDGRWYHVVNVPIRNANGTVSKHSVIADIHDLKLSEEKLREQKLLLEELNSTLEERVRQEVAKNREKDIMLIQQNRQAALGEMLDHIAHQWKQPITSLSLVLQELGETASEGSLTAEHAGESVRISMTLLDYMMQTLNVFRGFYRADKEKKEFTLKDAIGQALDFIAPALNFHSIAVDLDVDPGLTGFGYPKEYAQVLLNILANARDIFKARGTENPRILIRAYAEEDASVVTVTDNGGGIPEGIRDRIFDFYFTTNEAGGGTGIGLYMAKNIIEKNMCGTLRAENTADGACFRIEVPRVRHGSPACASLNSGKSLDLKAELV